MRSHRTAWPCRVTTMPSSGPGQAASKARAIAAEALPAPTTTVRPRTGGGIWGAIARAGSAAASAASNSARSNSPAATYSRVLAVPFAGIDFSLAIRGAISYRARRKGQRYIQTGDRGSEPLGCCAIVRLLPGKRRGEVRVFGRRGVVLAGSLALFAMVVAPSRAQPPEGPFAEVFAQLAGRLVGVVLNISPQMATPPGKTAQDVPQASPGSSLDEFFRDFFGGKGAPGESRTPHPPARSRGLL